MFGFRTSVLFSNRPGAGATIRSRTTLLPLTSLALSPLFQFQFVKLVSHVALAQWMGSAVIGAVLPATFAAPGAIEPDRVYVLTSTVLPMATAFQPVRSATPGP